MGPDVGINLFLSEDTIRWVVGGILVAGTAVAGWVWHLGIRLSKIEGTVATIERDITHMDREIEAARAAVRSVGGALDRKLEEQTDRLREQIDDVKDRLEDVKNELPSRGFVEGQIGALVQRIDRMFDVKLAGR